jgi:hypothetical protein
LQAWQSPDGRLLLAMSPYLLSYALFPDWWLRARGQLLQLGAANWAAVVCLSAAWLLVPRGDSVAYALAYGLAPLAGAAVAMWALVRQASRPTWTPSWTAWVRHLRTSLMFGAAGVGGQISVPVTLATMTATGDPRAAGAFALGMRAAAAAANALWLLLQNALPRLLAAARPVPGRIAAAAMLPPLLGVGVAALLWNPLLVHVVGSSYEGAGAYAALGALLLAVWGPKYVVEIGLVATFGDAQRIVVNTVAPVLVVATVIAGLASGRPWVMPVALLGGEGLAALVGYALLRRRRVAGSREVERSSAS